MRRSPTRHQRLELFKRRGPHRLVLEQVFLCETLTVEQVQQSCRLSHRFARSILERGSSAGVFRIARPGEYVATRVGEDAIGNTGGLMFRDLVPTR